jgi:hypothetical protein
VLLSNLIDFGNPGLSPVRFSTSPHPRSQALDLEIQLLVLSMVIASQSSEVDAHCHGVRGTFSQVIQVFVGGRRMGRIVAQEYLITQQGALVAVSGGWVDEPLEETRLLVSRQIAFKLVRLRRFGARSVAHWCIIGQRRQN